MRTSFKPPSKSLTPQDYQFIALILFGIFVFCAALLYANLNYINPLGRGGEFYVPWAAGRAFLFDHSDPFGAYVPEHVQQLVYGHAATSGDKPYITDIPFHLLVGYFPFSLLFDPQLARAIFTLVSELALFGLIYLSLRLTGWEVPPVFVGLFILFSVFNFYTVRALLEATPVLFLSFLYAGILYAFHTEQDELAGALVAVSCYHWEVSGPFLILIALHVLHERRTRILAGFAMISAVLLLLSLLIYPGWFLSFLRAMSNNLRADFGISTQSVLSQLWPDFGSRIALGLTILLVVALGYEWSIARGSNPRRFYWASCLSLAAAPLLGFRTGVENLVVLVLPLTLIFAITYERWRKVGGLLIFLLLLLILAVPWVVYYFVWPNSTHLAEGIIFLFLPIVTIIGLYWVRWWAIRPPRTLFDRARLR